MSSNITGFDKAASSAVEVNILFVRKGEMDGTDKNNEFSRAKDTNNVLSGRKTPSIRWNMSCSKNRRGRRQRREMEGKAERETEQERSGKLSGRRSRRRSRRRNMSQSGRWNMS